MEKLKNEMAIFNRIVLSHTFECMIVLLVAVIGLFTFKYPDGVSLTAYSVEIWDTIFSGNLGNMQEIFLENMRNAPHGGVGINGASFLIFLPWAIWNFPLWLTHTFGDNTNVLSTPCLLWSKLFLVFCAIVVGLQCYHIVYEMTKKEKRAKLATIFFLGSGTLFISIGYSMQDEIIYILAFLIALRYAINNQKRKCCVWLIITVTLSPFMLLPTILIFLFIFKNPFKIMGVTCLTLIPTVVMSIALPAISSVNDDYFSWFFTRTVFQTGYGSVSVFAVVTIVIYIIAYFRDFEEIRERNVCLLFLMSCLMGGMCILSWLHFYRFVICIPFFIISILCIEGDESRVKIGLILFSLFETVRMFGAGILNSDCWAPWYLSDYLKKVFGDVTTLSFSDILKIFVSNTDIIIHGIVFSTVGLLICILWILKENGKFISINISSKIISISYVLIPLLFFCCYFGILSRIIVYHTAIDGNGMLAPAINQNISIDQHFYAHEKQYIRQIKTRTVTWGREYPDDLLFHLEIIDESTSEILGSAEVPANTIPNNDMCIFSVSNIPMETGKWYTFRLSAVGTIENEEQSIYILHSSEETANTQEYYSTINDNEAGTTEMTSYDVVSEIVGVK